MGLQPNLPWEETMILYVVIFLGMLVWMHHMIWRGYPYKVFGRPWEAALLVNISTIPMVRITIQLKRNEFLQVIRAMSYGEESYHVAIIGAVLPLPWTTWADVVILPNIDQVLRSLGYREIERPVELFRVRYARSWAYYLLRMKEVWLAIGRWYRPTARWLIAHHIITRPERYQGMYHRWWHLRPTAYWIRHSGRGASGSGR